MAVVEAFAGGLPTVALVGRPNVGKSTLFNVLTRTRDAIVADRPGVTRDRHHGISRQFDRPFIVVDTGGLSQFEDELPRLAAEQAQLAIEEADVVVFVLDARDGLVAYDRQIAEALRRTGKPVVLAVNKTDGLDEMVAMAEFSELGFPAMLPLAAAHGRGVNQLAAAICQRLPEEAAVPADAGEEGDGPIRLAVLGRPNVGKSTLVNRLLGESGWWRASPVPLTPSGCHCSGRPRSAVRYGRTAGRVAEHEKFSVIKTPH